MKHKDVTIIVWDGTKIEVTHTSSWSNVFLEIYGFNMCHVEIKTLSGDPLPITDTGYYSIFISEPELAQAGGPVAYVKKMIECDAKKLAWEKKKMVARQYSLF